MPPSSSRRFLTFFLISDSTIWEYSANLVSSVSFPRPPPSPARRLLPPFFPTSPKASEPAAPSASTPSLSPAGASSCSAEGASGSAASCSGAMISSFWIFWIYFPAFPGPSPARSLDELLRHQRKLGYLEPLEQIEDFDDSLVGDLLVSPHNDREIRVSGLKLPEPLFEFSHSHGEAVEIHGAFGGYGDGLRG